MNKILILGGSSEIGKTFLNKIDKENRFDIHIHYNNAKIKRSLYKKCNFIKADLNKINEKNLSKYLLTKDIPDPDILIRTGNTNRLSNFLLWQLAYSEIFFERKLWPDFNEKDYNKIIKKFKKIKRNFGKI